MNRKPIFINGRFLAQTMTGVQRYAREVLTALDGLMEREPALFSRVSRIEILAPPEADQALALRNITIRKVGRLHSNLWEQVSLPWHARSGLLVGLCNINPLLHPRQVVVFHDASVFAVPQAYSAPFRFKYRLILWTLGRTARQVATVSNFSKAELMRFCGIRAEKIQVVPEGSEHVLAVKADEAVFAKHNIGERPFVLAVSSQSPHKNQAGLLAAATLLEDSGLDFVLAGGTFKSVFRAVSTDLPRNARAIGYVSDGELFALYQRAACFVYPSFYEGFGLPPLEAMRAGCPVVVSCAAALPEVCGDAARYVDPHRPEEIAQQILQASQPAERQALRTAGWQQASAFTWERAARAIWQVINKGLS